MPGRGSGPPRRAITCRLYAPSPKTGELAFHYCDVPAGHLLTRTRLIRAAALRGPVEEDFRSGKDCFGLDECQARLYTAILRQIVLVIAALAICAVTAAQLRNRTSTPGPGTGHA